MFFSYGGGAVYYSDTGKGSPVVLLHGYLESSEVWNGFSQKLSEKYRIIAVDLPGHGMSDCYGTAHTMEFMATAVHELIVHLQIGKVFMTGHSLGGYVTLAFLELFPGSLTGYCLFHSQPFADTPEAIEKRRREISIVRAGKKDLMYPDNILRMFSGSNLVSFAGALQHSRKIASKLKGEGIIAVLNGMIARPSRVSYMEKGIVPCLWILGEDDNYIPCDAIQKKVNLPPNATTVVLNKSGHMGFIEEEDLSVEIISNFINNL